MRVIGAGWGRTGTTSAAAALDQLGFGPSVRMAEVFARPELAETWNRHHDGESADWRRVLAGYGASVDWPGCWEWREFAELWPEAKVLLTVREPAAWYRSLVHSIHPRTEPGKLDAPAPVVELLARLWDEEFGGWDRVLDRDQTIARFEAHNDDVRRNCPAERLIEWDVSAGWAPLCQGLEVPVPQEPFPHLNRRVQ
jgi:Sulfotransferase domain